MRAIEQEIVEKFRLLDREARQCVLLQIEQETVDTPATSLDAWLAWTQDFGSYIHKRYGSLQPSSLELLDEAREERLNDFMGSG